MKKTLLLAVMIFAVGCEEFSTSYERIDNAEFRMLDFIYEPAELAPGDSVTLTAVFAGRRVDDLGEFIDWHISFNVIADIMGSVTIVDSIRLEPISQTTFSSTATTQSVSFRFKIPEDIVRTSASIPENWIDVFPPGTHSVIPPEFAAITKNDMINMIEDLVDAPSYVLDTIAPQLRLMLQFFTVPIRVIAKINDPSHHFANGRGHTIHSDHSVRYNSWFPTVAPINRNPQIDGVVVYKVRGDVTYLSDTSGREFERILLDNSGTVDIVIEDGFSYFLDARSSNFDKTWTLDGNLLEEDHRIFRQFHLGFDDPSANVRHRDFMTVSNMTGQITPPADRRITSFTFWITMYDEVVNERLRPQGSTLGEVSGRFVYGD